MTRNARRTIGRLSWLLAAASAALALGAAPVLVSDLARGGKQPRDPERLWREYPLVERPKDAESPTADASRPEPVVGGQLGAVHTEQNPSETVVSLLIVGAALCSLSILFLLVPLVRDRRSLRTAPALGGVATDASPSAVAPERGAE